MTEAMGAASPILKALSLTKAVIVGVNGTLLVIAQRYRASRC